jgi:hypothetical protein
MNVDDDYNRAAFELLVSLRGGVPKRCDFCGELYVEGRRWPVPEEAGAWSCSECEACCLTT